jgi:hypothetical protein
MPNFAVDAVAITLSDILRSKEVGHPVVSHVLENVVEPRIDFAAMQRVLSATPSPSLIPKHGESERSVSKND